MAPTWDELGSKFLGGGQVTVGKVDCTLDINKELCKQQQVCSVNALSITIRCGNLIQYFISLNVGEGLSINLPLQGR